MKMSGTRQKGTGKRNYSILMHHCSLHRRDTCHFLLLIFLRLRWFALNVILLDTDTSLRSREHTLLRFMSSSRFRHSRRRIICMRVIENSVARSNLLSIFYYITEDVPFPVWGTLRFAETLWNYPNTLSNPLLQFCHEDYSNFVFYKSRFVVVMVKRIVAKRMVLIFSMALIRLIEKII